MSMNPPADTEILATLKATFGYDAFRPLQAEIVRAVLVGRDAFVLMPTGGGKSLCYQLPALLQDGLTVVVSPLIALMKDQVDALRALGLPATFINSSLDGMETERRRSAVARGEIRLLYVAPERLVMPAFLALLHQVGVARFAIDEAHCISEWGHDFRPEYRELRGLRQRFPETPVAAFTATATARVQADILAQLRLRDPALFQGSFNRHNLFYDVRPKQQAYAQLVRFLRGKRGQSGIIYCQSRNSTETLATKLGEDGFSAAAYHAGLEPDERSRRQEAFIRDDVRIIVATVAFGMGIDKPDVRFVVHYDLPRNLEGYYQESGRAGRDGEPSECLLFYSYGDVNKYRKFIDEKPPAEREVALQQLRQITNWASDPVCRRRALLAYFGEKFTEPQSTCCDVCRDGAETADLHDFTLPARMVFAAARQTGERFGQGYLIEVLRGGKDERIQRLGHDQKKVYGVGKDRSKEDWRHLFQELMREAYIRVAEDDYGAIKVTERGAGVRAAGQTVLLRPARAAAAAAKGSKRKPLIPVGSHEPDDSLFEKLKTWRKRQADERGLPPYVIFHDRTLTEIAATLPQTTDDLLNVQGVGIHKMIDYGDDVLRIVASHTAPGLSQTVRTSVSLFSQGSTLDEIASQRELTVTTILGHLADAIDAGLTVEIDGLIDREKRDQIAAALLEVGLDPLRPVLDRLGEGYWYGELRLVRAWLRRPPSTALRDPSTRPVAEPAG